jgi:hypothetical protein
LVYPVIDGVLGALVYGEGDGADEGYAEQRRPDTAPEAMEALASICVADAVAEGVELVAGKRQSCLWQYESCRTLVISS